MTENQISYDDASRRTKGGDERDQGLPETGVDFARNNLSVCFVDRANLKDSRVFSL